MKLNVCIQLFQLVGLSRKISLVVIEGPSRNHSDLNEFILYDIHLRATDHTVDGNISL